MSGRIPREFIDELLVRVDIVDLIDSHVPGLPESSGLQFIFFEHIGAEIATEHATNLNGKPLEKKIEILIDLLGEEGFMSRLEKVGADHFVLTQVNCPYQYVATRHPEVCELDLQLMNTALGTAVKREACVANGDAVCTFHIKSQPIQLRA